MIGKALYAWADDPANGVKALLGNPLRFFPAGAVPQGTAFPRATYQVISAGAAARNFGGPGGLWRARVQITCTDEGRGGYQDAVDLANAFLGRELEIRMDGYAGGTLGGIVVKSIEMDEDSWAETETPPTDGSDNTIHDISFELLVMFYR